MVNSIMVEQYTEKYVKRNFVSNWLDGSFYAFAMSFVSNVTVVPVFVKYLGGSNVAVALIYVIWNIGFNLPQIFISNYAGRLEFKKRFVLKTAFIQRVPWLLMALFSFFIVSRISRTSGLIMFFVIFAITAITGSINMPAWFDLVAKVTPVHLRGRLFAARSILGSVLGITGGWVVVHVLENINYPYSFGLLFLLTFIVTLISYIFVAMIREYYPNSKKKAIPHYIYFRRLTKILKRHHNFRNFIIADALLKIALMADVFYSVHALEKFSLSNSTVGKFTIVMMVSMIAGNLLFGQIADRVGHRINLVIASVATTVSCVFAFFSTHVYLYAIVFVGSAFTVLLVNISRLSIISELCNEEDRPTYVALANLMTSPFILSSLLGGWIANSQGYNIVFIISGLFALCATFCLIFFVKEPRTTKERPMIPNLKVTP
ncbi:MFS transporter [candidate division KSB1 bacterium]|nr:MFS transporter [candidate division KSB1 bacterium]